ncbi:MAG: alpha/beta hydrolase, partial [Chitinophagaceae bacterium]|nr:alpha/beta hydrolase [Chitinophagaceae bacterium]
MSPLKSSLLLLFTFILQHPAAAQTALNTIDYGNNRAAGSFITINGAKQYYELYGQGEPLVLLHGNGGSIGYMKPQIEYFSK